MICLTAVFAITASSQSKMVRGYYCGGGALSNAFGSDQIRVGSSVIKYSYSFKAVKSTGMKKKNANKVGAEYVVKLRWDGSDIGWWAESITFTGRNKETSPCD